MGKSSRHLRLIDKLVVEIENGTATLNFKLHHSDGTVQELGNGSVSAVRGDTVSVQFNFIEHSEILEEHFSEVETKIRVIRT
jgi:hypothetical protein